MERFGKRAAILFRLSVLLSRRSCVISDASSCHMSRFTFPLRLQQTTEDNGCSQKALRNSVTSIEQPILLATPLRYGDVAVVLYAKVTHHSMNFVLATSFRAVGNPDQEAPPAGPLTDHQPPSSQPVPQGDPSMTARCRTAIRDIVLTRETQVLPELLRSHFGSSGGQVFSLFVGSGFSPFSGACHVKWLLVSF